MPPADASQTRGQSSEGARPAASDSTVSGGSLWDEQRRASFLHSKMQRRQQAKAEACGTVTGPSLAAAHAKARAQSRSEHALLPLCGVLPSVCSRIMRMLRCLQ